MTSGPPGLQEERTALAWQRTGIAASGGSAVGLLAAAHDGRPWLVAVVAVICVASAVCAAVVTRPWPATGHDASSPWTRLVATVAGTVLLAVTGLTLAVVVLAR